MHVHLDASIRDVLILPLRYIEGKEGQREPKDPHTADHPGRPTGTRVQWREFSLLDKGTLKLKLFIVMHDYTYFENCS